jgi:hypothetical protein
MKSMWSCLVGFWLAFASLLGYAQEHTAEIAPEPTVSVVWVAIFGLVFVGLCVWFVIAMIRSERKSKAVEQKAG